jgi:hypothetical protein
VCPPSRCMGRIGLPRSMADARNALQNGASGLPKICSGNCTNSHAASAWNGPLKPLERKERFGSRATGALTNTLPDDEWIRPCRRHGAGGHRCPGAGATNSCYGLNDEALMTDTVDVLILDLLEWIGPDSRPYPETIEAWRTSCPRLPVWEEANERGYLEHRHEPGRGTCVSVSALGRDHLRAARPHISDGGRGHRAR